MKRLYSVLLCVLTCFFISCAPVLMAPLITNHGGDTIHNYRYFYITPTGDYTSKSASLAVPIGFGMYVGSDNTRTTTPSHIIAGTLIKNGYIQVNEVNPENAQKTMIVNFGETGRHDQSIGYSIEVTIQFVSAATQRIICTCTADGIGETEADDIRNAIERALKPLFSN
ncbi:MAG: hypothetical protein J1F29_07910 [Lentimicrobiaceae bacterium]|nr:hypothetical protein [Lentimicrobiaceae bacterium]